MDVRLYATPAEFAGDDVRGCSAVVLDVLRTSSTIVNALWNGAREVIPVGTPAEAGEFASRTGRGGVLMCGEREGKMIKGFDLGNSPIEYAREKVSGRTLIFSSTNGTPALVKARMADRLYVSGFNNYSAVLNQLLLNERPIAIICSGRSGTFSIEDFVCGGKFVEGIQLKLGRNVPVNDGARAAALLYQEYRGQILDLLSTCQHGRYLASLGFENDLGFCAKIDSHPVLPTFLDGVIRGTHPDGTSPVETTQVTA